MLYAGEVDGVISNEILNNESILSNVFKFYEVKTSELFKQRPNYSYYLKLAKCWCQSSLSCVQKIVFGYRTEGGTVKELEEFTLDDVHEKIKQSSLRNWNPNAAKNFCHAFLKHVKDIVTKDHDKRLYKFCWDKQGFIKTEILNNVNNCSKYSFLPDKYTVSVSNKKQSNCQDRIVSSNEPEPHSSKTESNQQRFFRDHHSRKRQSSQNEPRFQITSTRYEPYFRFESAFSRDRGNPERNRNFDSRELRRERRGRGRNRHQRY